MLFASGILRMSRRGNILRKTMFLETGGHDVSLGTDYYGEFCVWACVCRWVSE